MDANNKEMNNTISPIINIQELLQLKAAQNLILLDASNRETYNKGHLDGAILLELDTDLANIKKDVSIGGRHPLPTIEQFSKTLAKNGISKESHVIIYDNNNGANAAARLWWMLKAVGHKKVQVLNGGFQEAERKEYPINFHIVSPNEASTYLISEWNLPIADIDEVELATQNEKQLIIDVRASNRYKGITEPIDLIAGHIPNAINVPFATNLNDEGLFLSPEKLKENYQSVFGNIDSNNVIVHCGSGVTACHTLLALSYAGLEIPKLYVGSWSEWSRNQKEMVN